MSKTTLHILAVAMVVLVTLAPGFAQTITTFDVPGATYTFPGAINPAGQITGEYVDANYAGHGFLRKTDGTFTTFDPTGSIYAIPRAINPAGQITGSYVENYAVRGFLRNTDGTFTTFGVPFTTTYPTAINPAGEITGWYVDASGLHGFLRSQ